MKGLHLLTLSTVTSALLIFAAAEADAQVTVGAGAPIVPIGSGGGGPRIVPIVSGGHGGQFQDGGIQGRPDRPGHGRFRGFGGAWIVEREVVHVIEREVVREPPAPPPPPPPPREPWVLGKSYVSLPGGCMKLIEGGASYYHCSGEWYRQVGSGSAVRYKAVARRAL